MRFKHALFVENDAWWILNEIHLQAPFASFVWSSLVTHYQPNEAWSKSLFLHWSAASLLVQGLDPDAPDEDEENEVEDAEGDQEETELLWAEIGFKIWNYMSPKVISGLCLGFPFIHEECSVFIDLKVSYVMLQCCFPLYCGAWVSAIQNFVLHNDASHHGWRIPCIWRSYPLDCQPWSVFSWAQCRLYF